MNFSFGIRKYSKRHVTNVKITKKITKFSIEGHTTSNIGETKSQKWVFFASSSLILIKRLYVCKYMAMREREAKKTFGEQKDHEKD